MSPTSIPLPTLAPVPMYANCLTLGLNAAIVISHLVGIVLIFHLLYCFHINPKAAKIRRLSVSLRIFLVLHLICASSAIPYHAYLVLNWTPTGGNYEPYVLLWLGLWVACYYEMSSASALFLTLDRCLALKFPTEYKLWMGRYFAMISVCGLAALSLVAWVNILVEIPLDVDKVRNCQTFNCIATKYRNTIPAIIRLTFGGINVLVGCYFVILLRATITAHKHNNRLVRITIIMDVSLNFLPAAIGQIFPLIFRSSAGYLAQTAVWLFSLNIAVCSFFYVRILLKSNYSSLISRCKRSNRVQRDRLFTQSTYPTTAISSTVTGE